MRGRGECRRMRWWWRVERSLEKGERRIEEDAIEVKGICSFLERGRRVFWVFFFH